MANLKLTGFGRLIIFLLIVAPIAYFGIQYLQKSGTLDSLKEKVENKADNQTATPEQETSEDILREIDRRSSAGNEQESIIAEQQRKIEELERKNQELQKRKEGGSSTISIPPKTTSPSLPPPPPSNNAPSLDDLIRQAENKTGRTTTSSEPSLPSPKESLASWDLGKTFMNSSVAMIATMYKVALLVNITSSEAMAI